MSLGAFEEAQERLEYLGGAGNMWAQKEFGEPRGSLDG